MNTYPYPFQTGTFLVGRFGFNGPLRQYFSLYRAVVNRGGDMRKMIDERKNVQTTPPAPTTSAVSPCPTITKISRTLRHWKFTSNIAPPDHPQRGTSFCVYKLLPCQKNSNSMAPMRQKKPIKMTLKCFYDNL